MKKLKLFKPVGDFFALDIGTTAVRVVELKGSQGVWSLSKYGSAPIDMKVSKSDSREDRKRLSEAITNLIAQSGISSCNVVVGIPSNKTFVTVVDLPELAEAELNSTIKYQAEQYIPMSVDEAKLDWANLGKSQRNDNEVEVLLASVSNKFSEDRLDLIEGLGLNVVALEPEPLALVRSLVPADNKNALMIIDFSDFSTDIVVVIGDKPRLVRSLSTGMQSLVKAAQQNLNVDENQATQFIMKFGLYPDRLEGQVYKALDNILDQFVAEVTKSIKFFQTRYGNIPLQSVIFTGYGVSIPAFNEYVGSKTGLNVTTGNPWQRVNYSQKDQQTLLQMAPKFAVAVGLAEREI
jgi:type IV pilus assembly protein PilM